MNTFVRVAALMTVLLAGMGIVYSAGCSAVSPAAKQEVQKDHDQAAIDSGKAADKGKVNDAKGEADPANHPLDAGGSAVRSWRGTMKWVAIVAFGAFAIFFGLKFTPLSLVSQIGMPVAGSLAAWNALGVITLPFLANKWALLGVAACAAGWIIYEIVHLRSVPKAIAAIKADVEGVSPATSPSPASAAASTGSGQAAIPTAKPTAI